MRGTIKTRLISGAIGIALVAAAAGCGSSDDSGSTSDASGDSGNSASAASNDGASSSSGNDASSGSSDASSDAGSDASSAGSSGGSASAPSCSDSPKSITVSVGYQPYAAGNSPTVAYMEKNKLFEQFAKDFCYDLTVEYKGYEAAAPMVPEMIAGRLDFGMWGDTPTLTAIAQEQPLTVISVGEGHLRFLVATRKDSGITNMQDLKGKTIAVHLGADQELAFLSMIKGIFGTTDYESLGMKLVNIASVAQAAKVPKGVDAAVVIYPALLKEQQTDKDVIAIADSFGLTDPGYDGPLGQGAGIEFPSAKDSEFAPEGFYLHRSMWLTRNAIIDEDPGVVSAFLAAEQKAVAALSDMDPKDVAKLAQEYWKLTPENGAKVVNDGLLFQRKFSWATRGDAVGLMKLSKTMAKNKIIDAPLTWEGMKANFAYGADVAKKAYEAVGSPDMSAFEPTDTDSRGKPTWKASEWAPPDQ